MLATAEDAHPARAARGGPALRGNRSFDSSPRLARIIARIVCRRGREMLLVDHGESRVGPALVEDRRVMRADAAKHAGDPLAVVLLTRCDNLVGRFPLNRAARVVSRTVDAKRLQPYLLQRHQPDRCS